MLGFELSDKSMQIRHYFIQKGVFYTPYGVFEGLLLSTICSLSTLAYKVPPQAFTDCLEGGVSFVYRFCLFQGA
jgi:hypothetical protein